MYSVILRVWLLFASCVLSVGCSRGSGHDTSNEPADTSSSPNNGGSASAMSNVAGSGAANGGASNQAGSGGAAQGGEPSARQLPNDTASGVFVHLFEWRWSDIALECERYLGPHGFTAVQVSPPNEHAMLSAYGYPWWQRYQPVSYALESRSGTRAEFVDMVSRCRATGVGIYVDAVLNHMTAQTSGTGSGGSKFTKYEYPSLYTKADFHPTCTIEGSDYAFSAEHVQQCELVGLADLDTANPNVQGKIASYLSELLQLGVRGFRLDAAKHLAPADLKAILAKVVPGAEKPYYFLEVIDYGGEAVQASDYLSVAVQAEVDVTEFKYRGVGDAFLGTSGKTLATLNELSEQSWSLLPTDRAVAFIANHDTQRADASYYQDGVAHELATVFMLAFPYGYPSIMSSYAFDRSLPSGHDIGPPTDGAGSTHPVYTSAAAEPSCVVGPYQPTTKGWVCEHRSPAIAGMVGFRKFTAGEAVSNAWDNGANQLAFSRGKKGFIAFNREATALKAELQTGLPAGTYCDVLHGARADAADGTPAHCSGPSLVVADDGKAQLSLAPDSAVALHGGSRL